MPTSTLSVRKTAPRQLMAKRRQSIAAFEQWQRNWSASLHGPDPRPDADADAAGAPKRANAKHADAHRSASHQSR
jgi:hypothetical protein